MPSLKYDESIAVTGESIFEKNIPKFGVILETYLNL